MDPLPVLVLRRGPVALRALGALYQDPRLELFVADELSPDWIAFAHRVSGVLVVTQGDPLRALTYAITAGLTTPIVMIVAGQHAAESRDLVGVGAAAVLTLPLKPSDADRIIPHLRTHARAALIDRTLRLLLDPVAREVRFHQKRVPLSQREFAVLHCLATDHGRAVSAEQLMTCVWGVPGAAEPSRQLLDVYIFQLRRKLEKLGLKRVIATVRGFGYMLVNPDEGGGGRKRGAGGTKTPKKRTRK